MEGSSRSRQIPQRSFRPSHFRIRNRGASLNSIPLLDTHIWIWWMLEDPRLPESHRNALDSFPPDQRPFLADISLWEASLLVAKGRLILDQDIESWLEIAASPSVVTLCPITSSVAAEMSRLPDTFHQDPADRLIVATARCLKIPLATQDRKIITSRLTRIWK